MPASEVGAKHASVSHCASCKFDYDDASLFLDLIVKLPFLQNGGRAVAESWFLCAHSPLLAGFFHVGLIFRYVSICAHGTGTVISVLSVVVLAVGYHRYFISTSTDFCIEVITSL